MIKGTKNCLVRLYWRLAQLFVAAKFEEHLSGRNSTAAVLELTGTISGNVHVAKETSEILELLKSERISAQVRSMLLGQQTINMLGKNYLPILLSCFVPRL